jgi:hypothetical protein
MTSLSGAVFLLRAPVEELSIRYGKFPHAQVTIKA